MEHMFDWLYKQANLQSMCSITSPAMRPEYQHSLGQAGEERARLLLTCTRSELWAGSLDWQRAKGRPWPEALVASSGDSKGLQLLGACKPQPAGVRTKLSIQQVQGSSVKPDVALKVEVPSVHGRD